MANHYRERLAEGAGLLGIHLSDQQLEQLLSYHLLLQKWNRVYNLTAVRDPLLMISRHLLDSLSVCPWLDSARSLTDVGSGAGLPGIPLAIMRPDIACITLDSNGKKSRFQQQAKTELGLTNLTVVQGRVEDVSLAPADLVIARAFAAPDQILTTAAHLCGEDGRILLMLGQDNHDFSQLSNGFHLETHVDIQVPFETGQRHIAICRRVDKDRPTLN